MGGQFIGWSIQDNYLIDEAGNKYDINEIRSLFFQRQLTNAITGTEYEISSLKLALEKKLKLLNSDICISLVNDGEVLEHKVFKI